MNYKIIWSEFSESQLNEIFQFYTNKAGKIIALKIYSKAIIRDNYPRKHTLYRTN